MAQPNAVSCRVLWSPVVDRARVRALMSEDERARYGRLAEPEDRARFATARALVRSALGRATGVSPGAVVFSRRCGHCGGPHGKPRVPGAAARFSLSHSGGRVVLAVTEHAEPGVDVERVTAREVDRLAPRVLSARELEDFRRIRPEDRTAAYHVYWTRKEAVLKAVGRGLSVPLRGLTLAAPARPAALLSWDGAPGDGGTGPPAVAMADLDPGPGYAAALAVEAAGRIELAEWTLDDPLDVP
ncbi:4'-phosphopantetheinyl transferase superfamily protein [Kitasatospora saccharophila]|uniref:4'-phosphopantetheinyl transferase superfamily protein n=1 Tax=Kitasatospora saccharophila TaxID=407973 RepID=A0ABN2WGA3_9ACTN